MPSETATHQPAANLRPNSYWRQGSVAQLKLLVDSTQPGNLSAVVFQILLDVDVGFDTANVITAQLELSNRAYPDQTQRVRFFEDLVERVQADGEKPVADVRWVHHDFQRALGVPVIAGRFFGPADTEDAPLGVIINEVAAREFWPNDNAVGKQGRSNGGVEAGMSGK